MTSKNEDTKARPAWLDDLLVLHRYARSRYFGETKSARSAAAEIDVTSNEIKGVWNRLEKEFGTYVVVKRATLDRKEESEDLQCAGDWNAFRTQRLEAWKQSQKNDSAKEQPEDGKVRTPPEYKLVNKRRLTLAGEIFGEVASLLAGYLSIAKRATTARADGSLEHTADLHRVLGWLQNERRRLHRIVSTTRREDASVFDLGLQLTEDHFHPEERAISDVLDMVDYELPAYDPSDPEEDPRVEDAPKSRPAPVFGTMFRAR